MNQHHFIKLIVSAMLLTFLVSCAAPIVAPTPIAPTATAVPPTATTVPPTATFIPPTATAVPPTATTAPTATRVPPTTTSVPLTATSVPPTATAAPTAAPGVAVTWFGQSMFTVNVSNGPLIMIDPMGASVGYKVNPINNVDAVAITHEHADHNNVALAPGSPKLLRGLAGNDWAKIDETIKGARIRTINVFHDDSQGSARGKNAIFAIEANGLKIVHLGDLGHLLSPEQVTAIGPIDVLMIPVGGNYTIDPAKATQVVDMLKPRAVFPMHYKTAVSTPAVGPVDDFLKGKTVEKVSGNKITISAQTLPKTTTVYVLGYE